MNVVKQMYVVEVDIIRDGSLSLSNKSITW